MLMENVCMYLSVSMYAQMPSSHLNNNLNSDPLPIPHSHSLYETRAGTFFNLAVSYFQLWAPFDFETLEGSG